MIILTVVLTYTGFLMVNLRKLSVNQAPGRTMAILSDAIFAPVGKTGVLVLMYYKVADWLATIHRDLWKLDIGLDNVPELATDRVLWRGLVRGTTHHSGACY